ncbi:MAG: outer membrane beta-barrel protein [Acidobacteria bacterium]|nr:outer membrane beta-barrel protein [Acidobacteriota bacterium]
MKHAAILILSLSLLAGLNRQAAAQGRNEFAFSLGGGSLQVNTGGGATAVFSLAYRFHITRHFSVEGALDSFNYNIPLHSPDSASTSRDDYLGAEAAVMFHFIPNRETGRLLPYVVAGIGKTTTDFTEIAAQPYYRLGAGVNYHLTERLGFQFEVRDEIIKRLWTHGRPNSNLPSIRGGIVIRF